MPPAHAANDSRAGRACFAQASAVVASASKRNFRRLGFALVRAYGLGMPSRLAHARRRHAKLAPWNAGGNESMFLRVATPYAAAAALAVAVAACSGSHGAGERQQISASSRATSQGTALPSAASQSAAPRAPSNLPVYPGAVKMAAQMQRPIKMCGSALSLTMYEVAGADAATVTKWYDARVNGGIHMSFHSDTGTTAATSENDAIFSPDGSSSVMVMQMHLSSKLAAAAKSIGADRTTIGLNSYDPPFSPDLVRAMQQAALGDEAAKTAARAMVKAKCGSDFAEVGG